MTDPSLLRETVILFGAALAVAWLFCVFRLPTVIGFLAAGAMIGPHGLGLIPQEAVGPFADVGLVLLLFIVGLELSFETLLRPGARLILAGLIQVTVLAAMVAVAGTTQADVAWLVAFLIGVALANSSTAIILKHLSDRGQTDSPAGAACTGLTLMHDMASMLVMLALPVAAATASVNWQQMAWRGGAAVAALVAATVALRYTLPAVLRSLQNYGGREMLALFAVVMACGGAWLAGVGGWSWALGSFLAGLLLSEADARHQLVAEILPFRDAFNALFFMSLGMLVDARFVGAHGPLIALAVVATLVVKSAVTAGSMRLCGWPLRLAIHVGLGLATVSEFGFVVAREATRLGLISEGLLTALIAYSVGTMLIGALLVPVAEPIAHFIGTRLERGGAPGPSRASDELPGHVVIVGYGLNGQNLARVLRATGIEHRVIEINPKLIRQARDAGERVVVGDAARVSILDRAEILRARALVVTINDPNATRRIIAQARAARPDLYILARTRYVSELDALYRLGANQVIPEEFETSIEIFAHVLKEFGIPDNVIDAQITMIRAGRYGMLRGRPVTRSATTEFMHLFEAMATQTFLVTSDSPVAGASIRGIDLRATTGVTIIAVVRHGNPTTNPSPDFVLEPGDVLVIVGTHKQLDAARVRLAPPIVPTTDAPPL
ncbi:MAG: cation:proton antiporter [Phycisphaerae bacterium]|nr:cation:proton antiporter [Phycisphaerae bacterium]